MHYFLNRTSHNAMIRLDAITLFALFFKITFFVFHCLITKLSMNIHMIEHYIPSFVILERIPIREISLLISTVSVQEIIDVFKKSQD